MEIVSTIIALGVIFTMLITIPISLKRQAKKEAKERKNEDWSFGYLRDKEKDFIFEEIKRCDCSSCNCKRHKREIDSDNIMEDIDREI